MDGRRWAFSLLAVPLVLVHLLVAAKVRHNGETASTTVMLTGKRFLASVAVCMRLQGTRPGETLVANLALVLLLRARGDFRAERRHHLVGDGNSAIEVSVRTRRSDNAGTLLRIAGVVGIIRVRRIDGASVVVGERVS